ncbi:MAG: peroxidase-related enzyme [Gammaproteobacteria bacterium]|jgi:uncharacterized peroxidase-related enzyme
MSFITTLRPEEAEGAVREMYRRQQDHYGYVPNYAKVFSHRPEIMKLWADLLYGIRRNMDKRRFELVTVAAATAVRSTYCSLAHGKALTEFYSSDEVIRIVVDDDSSPLGEAEQAMFRFARKVARDASRVTAGDVERLKAHGFSDAEIFDISAAATARTFFAQLCEGLGAVGDHPYGMIDGALRKVLTVGRPLDFTEPERLE